ncbi:hypothetical protein [Natronosalvus halobius]|uniref:hypothetical protein n=1 Tax=Natronosalvus halobius TaxID=2953746 RepID=UPI0020A0440B|nr:hypothetical protein [Natronosalvus halobius]USZ71770.1 hypothetical protein NGM15_00235 [Natronosalvus halobius]
MHRVVSGLGVPLATAGLVVAALWTVVDTYVVRSYTEYLLLTAGALVVAFAFVFVLFVLGARSDRWLSSPYW